MDDLATQLEGLHADAFGWALHCAGGDRTAAEDALQTSYLKILDGRARFDCRAAFRTWVFAVIRRTAAEERRRAAIRRWLPLGGAEVDHRTDPATRAAGADETERLGAALDRLSRRQREVLHLVFYQELTIAEAAAVL
ncbi:MAG: RNA polymerase sigma factor, partial [Gemmatimonadales bacterium]